MVAPCTAEAMAITASSSQRRRARSDCTGSRLPMRSLPGNDVAQAAHRLDEVGPELLAQPVDEHFDGVAAHVVLPAVQLFLELGAREDDAGTLDHRLEQRPF